MGSCTVYLSRNVQYLGPKLAIQVRNFRGLQEYLPVLRFSIPYTNLNLFEMSRLRRLRKDILRHCSHYSLRTGFETG